MARTRGPFGISLWAAHPFHSGPAPQPPPAGACGSVARYVHRVLPLSGGGIPARPSGRTRFPSRPPLPHAPAFVNDEARAVARHVSRDVCGIQLYRFPTARHLNGPDTRPIRHTSVGRVSVPFRTRASNTHRPAHESGAGRFRATAYRSPARPSPDSRARLRQ